MKIVAFHAHPDDVEFLATGTLALLSQRKHSVVIATMTPGDCGTAEHSREEISKIRRKEAAASAAIIGAEYICAEFGDLAVYNDHPTRQRVVEILRRVRPDVVLTASPNDYLCDHEITSNVVRDALFIAPLKNWPTGAADAAPVLPAIPSLYFMDALGGIDRDGQPVHADFVVDISSTFEVKKKMLASHASQRNWLLKHHGVDNYMSMMEQQTRRVGADVGFEFGEGFRHYRGHAYPQEPVLEDALGAGVIRGIRSPAATGGEAGG